MNFAGMSTKNTYIVTNSCILAKSGSKKFRKKISHNPLTDLKLCDIISVINIREVCEMKISVNELMSVCCYCDVYRKSLKEIEADATAKTLAETIVAEAQSVAKECATQEKGSN